MSKHVLQSKTLWFNVLTGAAYLLQWQGFIHLIPNAWAAAVPEVLALVNIVLRFYTNTGVSLTPTDAAPKP